MIDDCAGCAQTDAAGAATATQFRRILWLALWANLLMFAVEIAASRVGDSMSLQADAIDFFGDAANYAISLLVIAMAAAVRARAALFKGLCMALFGCWVIGSAIHRALAGSQPDGAVMGAVALLALSVNLAVAALLFRYRGGDSNARSVWLCSRNDAIGNIAVMGAAAGVFASASRWPDLIVATLIAGLNLRSASAVAKLALAELRSARTAAPD